MTKIENVVNESCSSNLVFLRKKSVFGRLRQGLSIRQLIWSPTFSKLFEIPLGPGQDIYKHSGNAKILNFFGLVRLL